MTERVLAGRYRLLSKLGEGGMGSVWRAEHLELSSIVAVKLINPSIAANPAALARFKQEAQSAASLRSPNVVQVLDYGIDYSDSGATPFIAMECLEGESLAGRLTRVGRLDPSSTQRVMSQVARAVSKAHEAGIVHRDLKPDNIFLVTNEDEEVAKVLDFGIAKRQQQAGAPGLMTQTGAVMGTPYYMSPEQATARPLDHRTDLWSLAVITYECLLGKRPFDADNISLLVIAICREAPPVPSQHGAVPAGFDAWFARGVAANPSDRFSSVREMMTALTAVCGAPLVSSGIDHHALTMPSNPGLAVTPGVAPARTGPEVTGSHQPSTATLPEPIPKKSSAGVLGAVAAVTLTVGIGILVLLRLQAPSGAPETPSAAPAIAAAPPAPVIAPVVEPSPVTPAPVPKVEPALDAQPSATVSAAPRAPVRAARGRAPTAAPVPAPSPVVKAPPPAPAPVKPPPPSASTRLDSEIGI